MFFILQMHSPVMVLQDQLIGTKAKQLLSSAEEILEIPTPLCKDTIILDDDVLIDCIVH